MFFGQNEKKQSSCIWTCRHYNSTTFLFQFFNRYLSIQSNCSVCQLLILEWAINPIPCISIVFRDPISARWYLCSAVPTSYCHARLHHSCSRTQAAGTPRTRLPDPLIRPSAEILRCGLPWCIAVPTDQLPHIQGDNVFNEKHTCRGKILQSFSTLVPRRNSYRYD